MKNRENALSDADLCRAKRISSNLPTVELVTPQRAIANILAHGVVRLHQRQKHLDSPTEQSVHDPVLVTTGETE
jgi:hypothetical protein